MFVSSQVKILSNLPESPPLSPEDSPASHTVLRENVKLLAMTVISGRSCGESFAKLNRDGFWVKTSQDSVQVRLDNSLEMLSETWPRWGIVSDGVVGKLPILGPVTTGNGCSLLRTPGNQEPGVSTERLQTKGGEPAKIGERAYDRKTGRLAQVGLTQQIQMLPTPRANENDQGNHQKIMEAGSSWKGQNRGATVSTMIAMLPTLNTCDATMGQLKGKEFVGNKHAMKLEQAINLPQFLTTPWSQETGANYTSFRPGRKNSDYLSRQISMLPTPTPRDHKDTGTMENVPVNALLGRELGKNHGMKLQPAFAEWMMGFPEGWTALNASEMPLSRNRSTRSSKQLQTLKEGCKV
jgi:hypothetical protein